MALTPPPVAPPAAPPLPGQAPSRANPSTFRELADAFVVWQVGFRDWLAGMVTWLAGYITWAGTNVTEMDALQSSVQTNANSAATNAAAAAAGAAEVEANRAALDNRLYPGTYAADPATRPDGSAVQAGDRYFNSAVARQKTYSGTVWATDNLDSAALAGAGGSSLSGFQASGTGAQVQDAQKKLRQKLNVMDYIDKSMWPLIESGTVAGQNAALVAAGIQAAIVESRARRKRLEASGGIYLHNALTISGPLEVEGEGRAATEFRGSPINTNLWSVTSDAGVVFAALTLSGNNASTSGAVLLVDNLTDVNYDTILDNVTIKECFDGFHPRKAGRFSVRNCYFVDCFGNAMTVENQINGDNGDSNVSGSLFANPAGSGYGLSHLSSGGLRLVSNKFLGFKKAYWMNPATGVATSILIAVANSVEGFTEHGFLFDASGGSYGNIQVCGGEISVFGAGAIGIQHKTQQNFNYSGIVLRAGGNNEVGIDIVSGGPGIIGSNTMQANTGNTGFGIRVQAAAANVTIAPQRFQGWGTNVSNSSVTSTDFSTLGSVATQPRSDIKAISTTAKTGPGQPLTVASSDAVNPLQMLFGFDATYTYIKSLEQGLGFRPLALQPTGGAVVVAATGDDLTGAKLQVNGAISCNPTTTTVAPAAGAAGALPAAPAGYKTEFINGVSRKIPYY